MGDLRDAFDRTTDANRKLVGGVDDALVAAGRAIADQVDFSVENLSGAERTKAMYLMPHLMNVLKEMLATPAARAEVMERADDGNQDLNALRATVTSIRSAGA